MFGVAFLLLMSCAQTKTLPTSSSDLNRVPQRPETLYVPFMYSGSNPWYRNIIADEWDCSGPAPFSLITGPSHPWGDSQMITSFYYPGWPYPWWSYGSFRDYSIGYDYVLGYTGCCLAIGPFCIEWSPLHHIQPSSNGFTLRNGYLYYTNASGSGSYTVVQWQFENFWVEQRIECQGDSFGNSRILIRYRVRNTSGMRRCYGLRLLLDINVASYDGAYFWDPINGWRDDEEGWDAPIPFDYWVISEASNWTGSYYIYGNIRETDWGMTPTEPDHFAYAYWGDFVEPFGNGLFGNVWDDCSWRNRTVGGVDAAVAYWWGWTNGQRCLGPGEEDTLFQFFFSTPEPVWEETKEEGKGVSIGWKDGKLWIRNAKGLTLFIFDLSGRLVLSYHIKDDSIQIPLPIKGEVYIAQIGEERYKIVADK